VLAHSFVIYLEGLVSSQDHTNHVCAMLPLCTSGNKSYNVLFKSSITKMIEWCLEEVMSKTHLWVDRGRHENKALIT
jgi:hypothetical protein